jgi:hypothetical protein
MEAAEDLFDGSAVIETPGGLAAISRSEVEMQVDTAHKYPRSITKCLRDALTLATYSPDVARGCWYSVPRKEQGRKKMIEGPSIRLAEMIANSWSNMHIAARVAHVDDRSLTAQALVWDLERNVKVAIETPRSIMTSGGKRFGDNMIQVTGAAAISIAMRNAIFRVVPRVFVDQIMGEARKVAVGDAKTIVAKRDTMLSWFTQAGVPIERVLAPLGVREIGDVSIDHLATLIGMRNAIKEGTATLDEMFPDPQAARSSAPPVSAGNALSALVAQDKEAKKKAAEPKAEVEKPAEPAPAPEQPKPPAPLATIEVQAALVRIDEQWGTEAGHFLIEQWTDEQRAAAVAWAEASNDGEPPPAFMVQNEEQKAPPADKAEKKSSSRKRGGR